MFIITVISLYTTFGLMVFSCKRFSHVGKSVFVLRPVAVAPVTLGGQVRVCCGVLAMLKVNMDLSCLLLPSL